MISYPKDKNGKEFKSGDLFIENFSGKEIWNGKAKILIAPIGLFIGEKVRYPSFEGWVVKTYIEGMVQQEDGSFESLYISQHDGEFMGDWNETVIIGDIEEMNLAFEEFCLRN